MPSRFDRPPPLPYRTTMLTRVLLLLACLAAAGCGGGGGDTRASRPVTPIDPATTGAIEVDVQFQGTVPPMKELVMSSFPECAARHQGPVLAGDMLVREGKCQHYVRYVYERP